MSQGVNTCGILPSFFYFFFLFFLTFYFALGYSQLTNKVLTVSGEQQRNSAINIHTSILPQTSLPSRLPHNTEQSSLCCTAGPRWLSVLNIAVCACPSLLLLLLLLSHFSHVQLVRPHRQQPTRLRHPWDSPGKNTGVGCHFLLQCMKVKSESEVAQSYLALCDPMDCSPPGSSVHGILQARVLEWGAIAFSDVHPTLPNYPFPSPAPTGTMCVL